MEIIIGIVIGIMIGFIGSRVIAYRNVKSIGQEFRTVAKRREYRNKSYKKNRPTHNGISDDLQKKEEPKRRKNSRKNTGKRKYYKKKNNTNKSKKPTQA